MAQFLLQAIDPSLGCSILEAIMTVDDPEVLRSLLGADAEDDKDFSKYYILDQDEARSITERFSVQFDLISDEVHLSRWSFDEEPPYLIHTNFELLLMLDGRKPFSTFTISYPIEIGEDRIEALFEPHVQSGPSKNSRLSSRLNPQSRDIAIDYIRECVTFITRFLVRSGELKPTGLYGTS